MNIINPLGFPAKLRSTVSFPSSSHAKLLKHENELNFVGLARLVAQMQGKIDLLHYVSELLIEITRSASSHNLRQLECFLSMAAAESSDSLADAQQQLKNTLETKIMDYA